MRGDCAGTATRLRNGPRQAERHHTFEAIGRSGRRMLQLRAAHLPREPSTRPAHRVRPAPTPLRGGAVRRCNAYGPMAANESSGPSFYASVQESSATQVAVLRGFALRHALFQLVAAHIFRCMAISLVAHSSPTNGAAFSPRCDGFAKSIRKPDHFRQAVRTGRAVRCHRVARMQHEPCDTRARSPVTSRWLRARCPSCAAP